MRKPLNYKKGAMVVHPLGAVTIAEGKDVNVGVSVTGMDLMVIVPGKGSYIVELEEALFDVLEEILLCSGNG